MTSSLKMKKCALVLTVLLTVTHAGKVAVLKDPAPKDATCGAVGVITNFDRFMQDLYNPLYTTTAHCASACAANTTCKSFDVRSDRASFCELHSGTQDQAGFVEDNNDNRTASPYQGFDLACFDFVEASVVDQTSKSEYLTTPSRVMGRSTSSSSSPVISLVQDLSDSASTPVISVTSPATFTSSSTLFASSTTTPYVCHEDNCYRAFLRFDNEAREFCSGYTASGGQTASVPTYMENCEGNESMITSGCNCLATYLPPAWSTTSSPPAIQTSSSSSLRSFNASSSSSTMTRSDLPSSIPSFVSSSKPTFSSITASLPAVKAFPPVNRRPYLNSTRPQVTGFLNVTSSGVLEFAPFTNSTSTISNVTMTASIPPVEAFPPTNWRPFMNSTKCKITGFLNATSSAVSNLAPFANSTRSLSKPSIADATFNGFLSNFGATPMSSSMSPNSTSSKSMNGSFPISTTRVEMTSAPQSTSSPVSDEPIFEPVRVVPALAPDMVGIALPIELQGIAIPVELKGIALPVSNNKTNATITRRAYDMQAVKALNLPSGFEGNPEATPYVKSVISLVTITTALGGKTETLVLPTNSLPPPLCGLSLDDFMYPEEAYHAYCPDYTSTTSAETSSATTTTDGETPTPTTDEEELAPVTMAKSLLTLTMTNFGQVSTMTRSSDDLPPPPCGLNLSDFVYKEEAYRTECPGYISTTTAPVEPKNTASPMMGRASVSKEKTSDGEERRHNVNVALFGLWSLACILVSLGLPYLWWS